MPRRKHTLPREPLDVAAPPSEERRRTWERILKLSPGTLGTEQQRRLQQARDAQILQSVHQSLLASGFDNLNEPGVMRKVVEEKE